MFEPAIALTSTCHEEASACTSFSTFGAFGILDTGATKTVIGSQFVAAVLKSLKPSVRDEQVKRCPCQVTFRFGNHGTLESKHAMTVAPIGLLFLKIAIVPGLTAFFAFEYTFACNRGRSRHHSKKVYSPLLKKTIPIAMNEKGLYLIDLNDLASPAHDPQNQSETFVTSNVKNNTLPGSVALLSNTKEPASHLNRNDQGQVPV